MNPITYVQKALDQTTMYRVVIYGLIAISVYALLLSLAGVIAQKPLALALSFLVINIAAWVTHEVAVRVTKAPGNVESTAITALILFLILAPESGPRDLGILAAIASGAIVLKYVVRVRLRHIANPAALALVIAGLATYTGSVWWVGSRYLLPIAAFVGLLIALKTRREMFVLTYIVTSACAAALWFLPTTPIMETVLRHFLSWPTIFFATVMLTEPLALPSTRNLQYWYAGIAAVLSSIPFSIGPLYGTPELALVIANVFTLVVDRPFRAVMTFVSRSPVGADTYEYRFTPDHPLAHGAGQYLEWTLPHEKSDMRGIRRYFTISSEPGAGMIAFAVRHLKGQSTWKQSLERMQPGDKLYATQRAGDFMLRAKAPAHVFIAGGIGITPFVSMARDAKLRGEKIKATLFYCNKTENDIAYKDLVEEAFATVHVLDTKAGFITDAMIKKYVPQWQAATYYISGPPGLVGAYEKLVRRMGIKEKRVIVDYFPGLA
jgi:glycine betaine catabolism B